MNVLPVVKRELRAEARHGMTYWSRVIMAVTVAMAIVWISSGQTLHQEMGARMFTLLNTVLFLSIWLVVPLLTADSLAREKREGTLGLLFMTHLRAGEIVLGKSLMHSLRGLNLLVAIIPLQIIPVVLGGVGWQELVMAASVNAGSVGLALAAGISASAICREWWHAFPLAILLGFLLMFVSTAVLFHAHLYIFFRAADGSLPFYSPMSPADQYNLITTVWARSFFLDKLGYQLQYGTGAVDALGGDWDNFWKQLLNLSGGAYAEICIRITLAFLVASLVAAWGVIGLSATVVAASWRVRPDSERMIRLKSSLFSPVVWKSRLKSRLQIRLNTNPVSWLHEYSWNARVMKWGLCLMTMFVCAYFLKPIYGSGAGFVSLLRIIMITIICGMAFSAVSSFRTEKDSGGMELLLITPLSTDQIIHGQTLGVWKRYLPTMIVVAGVWYAIYLDIPGRFSHLRGGMHWSEPLLLFTTTYTVAAIGVRFAFSHHGLLTACGLTLATGLVLPAAILVTLEIVLGTHQAARMTGDPTAFVRVTLYVILLLAMQIRLVIQSRRVAHRNLEARTFFLGRAPSTRLNVASAGA